MTRIDGIIVFKNISELCKCPHLIFHVFATIYCMRVQRMSSCFGEAIIERRLTQLVAEVKKAMSHQQLANINTIPIIVKKIQKAHKYIPPLVKTELHDIYLNKNCFTRSLCWKFLNFVIFGQLFQCCCRAKKKKHAMHFIWASFYYLCTFFVIRGSCIAALVKTAKRPHM